MSALEINNHVSTGTFKKSCGLIGTLFNSSLKVTLLAIIESHSKRKSISNKSITEEEKASVLKNRKRYLPSALSRKSICKLIFPGNNPARIFTLLK